MSSGDDFRFMREALALADEAGRSGEVPIGAVVVLNGEMVGRGRNGPIGAHDPTAHAEIEALRNAARAIGNYRLTGATVYVTVEPCLMCVGAMIHARVGTVAYGAPEPKTGALESTGDRRPFPFTTISGILAADCREKLRDFFAARRKDDVRP